MGGSRSWPVRLPFLCPHPTGRSARTFHRWRDAGFQHQEAVDLLWRRAEHPPEDELTATCSPGLPLPPESAAPGCNVTSGARCPCGSPGRLRDLPANSTSAGGMEAAPGPAGWGSIPSSTNSGSLLSQPRRLLTPSWRRPPLFSAISTPGGDPPPPSPPSSSPHPPKPRSELAADGPLRPMDPNARPSRSKSETCSRAPAPRADIRVR